MFYQKIRATTSDAYYYSAKKTFCSKLSIRQVLFMVFTLLCVLLLVHRTLNFLSVIVMLVPAGFVVLFAGRWSCPWFGDIRIGWAVWHSLTGAVSVFFALTQPLGALFRCGIIHPKRPLFNWAHRGVGLTAFVLALLFIYFDLTNIFYIMAILIILPRLRFRRFSSITIIVLLLWFAPQINAKTTISTEDAKIKIDGPLCWVQRITGQIFPGIVCTSTVPTATTPEPTTISPTSTTKTNDDGNEDDADSLSPTTKTLWCIGILLTLLVVSMLFFPCWPIKLIKSLTKRKQKNAGEISKPMNGKEKQKKLCKKLDDLIKVVEEKQTKLRQMREQSDDGKMSRWTEFVDELAAFEADLQQRHAEFDEIFPILVATSSSSSTGSVTRRKFSKKEKKDKDNAAGRGEKLKNIFQNIRIDLENYHIHLNKREKHLQEMESLKNFSIENWQERYVNWVVQTNACVSDVFERIKKKRSSKKKQNSKNWAGSVTRREFINEICSSGFPTTPLEMALVADKLTNGKELIAPDVFMNALNDKYLPHFVPTTSFSVPKTARNPHISVSMPPTALPVSLSVPPTASLISVSMPAKATTNSVDVPVTASTATTSNTNSTFFIPPTCTICRSHDHMNKDCPKQ
ncbi:hypothetical protein niasHT_001190 [Heterodera trifolii]|uniref:Cytochrome b561 domain-containing protein n=1 Tax=Heterodera trifolii TaxID=157864 RepID=A0ABD2MCS6_9BILA